MTSKELPRQIKEPIERYQLHRSIPSRDILEDLYWKRELSQRKIAKLFQVGSKTTVQGWFSKRGIKARDRVEASVKALMKYPKRAFDGASEEKAHMLGFAQADLHTKEHSRQIMLSTTTSHPAMIDLVRRLFSPYGRVGTYPCYHRRRDVFGWIVYALLDRSFDFLIGDKIPSWVLESESCFYAYLGGRSDGDANIGIYAIPACDKIYIERRVSISSKERKPLDVMRDRLRELDYHAVVQPTHSGYALLVRRKRDVFRLLHNLLLKHSEKTMESELILATKDKIYWSEVKDKVKMLRESITREVLKFTEEAESEYLKRHPIMEGNRIKV